MELLTTSEVADILRVSRVIFLRWLSTGQLKGHRIGKRLWRIDRTDLKDFLDRNEGK